MADMLRRSSDRLPAESHRTDSLPVRTVSQPLRIDAKASKGVFLEAVNETKKDMALSVEAMAINAGCTTSQMGDALAGKDSRNFAGHWLIAQGPEFVRRCNDHLDRQLCLSNDAEDAMEAETIGTLVEQLVKRAFRARRPA